MDLSSASLEMTRNGPGIPTPVGVKSPTKFFNSRQLSPIKPPGSIVFFSFLELQKDEEDKLSFRTGIQHGFHTVEDILCRQSNTILKSLRFLSILRQITFRCNIEKMSKPMPG